MNDASRRSPINLITFSTMLDGPVTETAEKAYATAVELSVRALDPADDTPEPLHDALARFAALSDAGLLKVIS